MPEYGSILLAEDNPKDVELILETLADNHFLNRVVRVKDGVEAMRYLHREGEYESRESGNPAVTILDIKMPRMDGIEVLRAIRSDPDLKHMPVVMLTSSREEQDIVRSYELGINAYVVKPVRFSDFVDAVRQIGIFWAMLNEPPPKNKQ
ncbi:MAG TPA: two-component system response regulator [Treponema sp.]|nr:MAG: two-component system response regulator [Treponema sp. GWA1_62_8]OHE62912.1 MAG: two-component system response regulator [Treponema sp. GWC1_61_84]HCM26475.1 two-component system response regulator [Treponema sp.]